ncbi:MAG: hypothetical protein WBA59_06800 [Moheibacter sp.]
MEDKDKNTEGFIPKHGGYRNLITYQKAEIIFDATDYFTKRAFGRFDRTIDRMVQAARSGKQNIVEASMASGTSKEAEIKLTNVARAFSQFGFRRFVIITHTKSIILRGMGKGEEKKTMPNRFYTLTTTDGRLHYL